MPADPTRAAPEWAVRQARSFLRSWWEDPDTYAQKRDDLAHLLASVRDAALREAAEKCGMLAACLPDGADTARRQASACKSSILALVGTAPTTNPAGANDRDTGSTEKEP